MAGNKKKGEPSKKVLDTLSSEERSAARKSSSGLPVPLRLVLDVLVLAFVLLLAPLPLYWAVHGTSPLHAFIMGFQNHTHLCYGCIGLMFLSVWGSKVVFVLPFQVLFDGFYSNNGEPRGYAAKQRGYTARALSAHANATEMFPQFAIAVLVALAAHVPAVLVAKIAVYFLITRVVYHVVYLLNWSTLRSTVWVSGYLAVLSLFALVFFPALYDTAPAKLVGPNYDLVIARISSLVAQLRQQVQQFL